MSLVLQPLNTLCSHGTRITWGRLGWSPDMMIRNHNMVDWHGMDHTNILLTRWPLVCLLQLHSGILHSDWLRTVVKETTLQFSLNCISRVNCSLNYMVEVVEKQFTIWVVLPHLPLLQCFLPLGFASRHNHETVVNEATLPFLSW